MVKKIVVILSLSAVLLNADIYETNCVSCHNKLPVSIDKYFYRYLLKYSSEREVKEAMLKYLQSPSKEASVMGESFLSRFGVKKKSSLSNANLKISINIYWAKYNVFEKLH